MSYWQNLTTARLGRPRCSCHLAAICHTAPLSPGRGTQAALGAQLWEEQVPGPLPRQARLFLNIVSLLGHQDLVFHHFLAELSRNLYHSPLCPRQLGKEGKWPRWSASEQRSDCAWQKRKR
jgi:hypothetical protein